MPLERTKVPTLDFRKIIKYNFNKKKFKPVVQNTKEQVITEATTKRVVKNVVITYDSVALD